MKKKILLFIGSYFIYLILVLLIFYFNGIYMDNTTNIISSKRILLFPIILDVITFIIILFYNKYVKKYEKLNFKVLLVIFLSIIILGILFGIIDYNRIKSGEMPIFVIAEHDKSGPEINYYGLGYKVVRNPGVSHKEQIYNDNYVKFGLWFYTWKIEMHKPSILYT